MVNAGIAVFTYNRSEHLKKVLDGLKRNDINHMVYIFQDGIKSDCDLKQHSQVRKIINEIVLELLGLNGYTAIREYQSNAMKKTSATTRKKAILYVSKEKIWNSRN